MEPAAAVPRLPGSGLAGDAEQRPSHAEAGRRIPGRPCGRAWPPKPPARRPMPTALSPGSTISRPSVPARTIRFSLGLPTMPRATSCAGSSSRKQAGEAGFDDLVAMTQVKLPVSAKLELARNYWDEMGRGNPKGMHGPMLDVLAQTLAVEPAHRDHGGRKPGAGQCDDRHGDRAPLCLACRRGRWA